MVMFPRFLAIGLVVLIVLGGSSNSGQSVPITAVPEDQATPDTLVYGIPEPAKATPRVSIPDEPVHMFIRRGEESRFEIFFLDVRYDHDVSDFEFYKAWCLEKDKKIRTTALHQVRLTSYDDPGLPPKFKAMPWHQINYLINHKEGSKTIIQEAIWYLADNRNSLVSPDAMELVKKAAAKGKDFEPSEGQLAAVICHAAGQQSALIELRLPEKPVVEVFPSSYEPPSPVPETTSLPSWLPLAFVPLLPPFVIPDNGPPSGTTPPILDHPTPPSPPPHQIPEPFSLYLVGTGLAGLYALRKKKGGE